MSGLDLGKGNQRQCAGFGYPRAPKEEQGAHRVEDTKIIISRAVKSAARWQIITTTFIALVAWPAFNMHAAVSVAVGGASALVGGYAAIASVRRGNNPSAGAILISLLKAELIRIIVIALILLAAFKFYRELVPLALIGGLAIAVLISGAGLKALGNENK